MADSTDLTDGTPSEATLNKANFGLQWDKQRFLHRRIVFYGACFFISISFAALLAVVFFSGLTTHIEQSHLTFVITIFAIIPVVLALALLRYMFSEKEDKKTSTDLSPFLALCREVVMLLSNYLTKK